MTPGRVALRSVAFAAALLGTLMLSGAVNPVDLLSPARTGQGSEVILEDFGPDGIRAETPFDGQYIYVTARLLPDLDAISDQLFEADYRLVRILHPLLASPVPSGTPTIYALQLWNIIGVGLFAGSLADVLRRHGVETSGTIGATLAASALPLLLTTSEPLAFGLGMLGLCLADRRRLICAVLFLALAGLTRESALTFAAAAAIITWSRGRRVGAAALLALSAAPVAVWWAYVQAHTPTSRTPLAPLGVLKLVDQSWDEIVVCTAVLGLIGASVVAWWKVLPLRWLALGFAAWVPLYESFTVRIVSLPRVSSPSVALGLLGVVHWLRARRQDPDPQGARTSDNVPARPGPAPAGTARTLR